MGRHYGITVGTLPSPAVSAPTEPFQVGVDVGVPTGTSLTATSGLPAADATETLTLTHPISGAEAELTVSVWRRRRWTSVITPTPAAGVTYLFDECEFDVEASSWCIEVGEANGTPDQMQPLAVFRNCTFVSGSTSGKALLGSYIWLIDCHLAECEDGFAGAAWSVVTGSNLIAGTDGLADPHADGVQISSSGGLTLYRSWISAGGVPGAQNAAVRVGTEFGACPGVDVYYCGLDAGGYTMQMRGDSGPGEITGVRVVGCRWVDNAVFGPVDFEETTIDVWSDNAYMDGTPISNPVP